MLAATHDSCADSAAESGCTDIVLSREGHDLLRDHGFEALDAELGGRRYCVVPSTEISEHLERLPSAPALLPRIISGFHNDGRYILLLEIAPDLSWFAGHFPGQPVLPGIIQLHLANVIACALFGLDGPPIHIKRLKFSNIIVPPRVVELVLEQPGPSDVQFRVHGAGKQNSQGHLVYGNPGS